MDVTLIVNPGSSSKKYAFYSEGKEVFSALYERTDKGFGRCLELNAIRQKCEDTTEGEFEEALHDVVKRVIESGVLPGIDGVTRVGIRIVAPGNFFLSHRLVDEGYIERLESVRDAAPLHVPHQLSEIKVLREVLPQARIVGVSDSAFHANMPDQAKYYSLPRHESETLNLYRFGYHGLSLGSIVRQVEQMYETLPSRMVVCHVGSGISVTAIKEGKSVDTTMGFAPTSGLIMGTRAGEVDPSALIYLLKQHKNDVGTVERIVSQEGGLKGLLGNGDLRIALDRYVKGDEMARLAVTMYIASIRKAVGSMIAVLGGIDLLVLTGTAPERNPIVRKMLTENFAFAGIQIDLVKNDTLSERPGVFSTDTSPVIAHVMHTAELREIAHVAMTF